MGGTKHRYLRVDNVLYIWCAGTYGWKEWAYNLDIRRRKRLGRRVNIRDYVAMTDLYDIIKKEDVITSECKVITCGFSRGGGIAQLLYLFLKQVYGIEVEVHLFASKRSVSKADDIKVQHNSATKGDVVPYLPFWPLYRLPTLEWVGPRQRMSLAHNEHAKLAARWRHNITKQ